MELDRTKQRSHDDHEVLSMENQDLIRKIEDVKTEIVSIFSLLCGSVFSSVSGKYVID